MENKVRRWTCQWWRLEGWQITGPDFIESEFEFVRAEDYDELAARLAEAEKVLEFYQDQSNWGCVSQEQHVAIDQSDWRLVGDFDETKGVNIRGGKRAHKYFKKHKENK